MLKERGDQKRARFNTDTDGEGGGRRDDRRPQADADDPSIERVANMYGASNVIDTSGDSHSRDFVDWAARHRQGSGSSPYFPRPAVEEAIGHPAMNMGGAPFTDEQYPILVRALKDPDHNLIVGNLTYKQDDFLAVKKDSDLSRWLAKDRDGNTGRIPYPIEDDFTTLLSEGQFPIQSFPGRVRAARASTQPLKPAGLSYDVGDIFQIHTLTTGPEDAWWAMKTDGSRIVGLIEAKDFANALTDDDFASDEEHED